MCVSIHQTVLMYLYVRIRSTLSFRKGALDASRNFFGPDTDESTRVAVLVVVAVSCAADEAASA